MIIKLDSQEAKAQAIAYIQALPVDPVHYCEIKEETRKLSQNAQQWPILAAFAKQVPWPVDGVKQLITDQDWKHILTAAYRNETKMRIAQGLEGGVVVLGQRTREFTKKEWPDWMAFLNWAAADRDVKVPVSKRQEEQLCNQN